MILMLPSPQVRPAHHRREKVCSPGLQSERHALALQAPSFQHLSTSRKLESFQLVFQREDCEKSIKSTKILLNANLNSIRF